MGMEGEVTFEYCTGTYALTLFLLGLLLMSGILLSTGADTGLPGGGGLGWGG